MFIEYNPNPVGRRVEDCAIRAIAKALDWDWEKAYAVICSYGFAMGDMPHSISVSGEAREGSRAIYTPAAVDQFGNVTARAVVDIPKGCCFTVAVEYVDATTPDPTTVPTPVINVIDGSLDIERIA